MSQALATTEAPGVGVTAAMAHRFGMDPRAFEATLRATVVPKECTKEQFAAFLLVAKEYSLNPILKEIYAFPARGGIQPVVSIDGWMRLMNSHPQFDGIQFEDHLTEDGQVTAITAKVFRKDRAHAVSVTEYLAECARATEPWKQWPRRMLRHKAAIQAARYAFGFSGILEPDEAERGVAFIEAPPVTKAPPVAIAAPAVKTERAKPAAKSAPAVEVEAEDIRSPDEVLAEMENVFSGMTDEAEAREIFANDYANNPALAFPGDMARAKTILSDAIEKITA